MAILTIKYLSSYLVNMAAPPTSSTMEVSGRSDASKNADNIAAATASGKEESSPFSEYISRLRLRLFNTAIQPPPVNIKPKLGEIPTGPLWYFVIYGSAWANAQEEMAFLQKYLASRKLEVFTDEKNVKFAFDLSREAWKFEKDAEAKFQELAEKQHSATQSEMEKDRNEIGSGIKRARAIDDIGGRNDSSAEETSPAPIAPSARVKTLTRKATEGKSSGTEAPAAAAPEAPTTAAAAKAPAAAVSGSQKKETDISKSDRERLEDEVLQLIPTAYQGTFFAKDIHPDIDISMLVHFSVLETTGLCLRVLHQKQYSLLGTLESKTVDQKSSTRLIPSDIFLYSRECKKMISFLLATLKAARWTRLLVIRDAIRYCQKNLDSTKDIQAHVEIYTTLRFYRKELERVAGVLTRVTQEAERDLEELADLVKTVDLEGLEKNTLAAPASDE